VSFFELPITGILVQRQIGYKPFQSRILLSQLRHVCKPANLPFADSSQAAIWEAGIYV
jgi:hypothetical protein